MGVEATYQMADVGGRVMVLLNTLTEQVKISALPSSIRKTNCVRQKGGFRSAPTGGQILFDLFLHVVRYVFVFDLLAAARLNLLPMLANQGHEGALSRTRQS